MQKELNSVTTSSSPFSYPDPSKCGNFATIKPKIHYFFLKYALFML